MTARDIVMSAAGASAPVATDPNFENVTLLLSGDGTNGAQNNTFLDSSTNNFTITRNGNTTQGTFSPYGNLWSNYFDGNGDYLTVPNNAAFNFGTGDFTIEAWVFIAGDSSLTDGGIRPANIVTAIPSSGTVNGWAFYILGNSTTTGTAVVFENAVSSVPYKVTYTATIPKNTWLNIAVARSGTVTKLFLNGTEVASATLGNQNISNYSNATVIGASTYAGYGSQLNGYLSNVRIVKGTALYTSNFTPSTTPLTAISGTSLLTCQSNRFRDNSSNNFTITRNGDVRVTKFSPFNPTAPYSASTIGGSGYFDGSGDYLSASSNTAFALSGAYTVELWFYPTVTYTTSTVNVGLVVENTSGGFALHLQNGSGGGITIGRRGVGVDLVSGAVPVANMWNHIVAVRNSSNSTSIYLNGTRVANATVSSSYASSGSSLEIGAFLSSNVATGYFCGTRIVKGTAVYDPTQSTITVPTAPLTAITNTSLLLNFTNAGIPDLSMQNNLETVGNAQVSTSVKKYGTGSLYFDGTGDWLILNSPTPNLYAFGSGDFTVEFWLYLNATQTAIIYDSRPSGVDGWYPEIYLLDNSIRFYSNSTILITGATLSNSTWYHVAVCKSGASTKMFINGTQSGSTYSDTNTYLNAAQRPTIGANGNSLGGNPLNGYIDDLRITKGYARYPTEPFPTAALPLY